MMKTAKIASLVAFAAFGGAMSQAALAAADGQVKFTGLINAAACSVSPVSQNLTVPLGNISTNVFTTVGSKSAASDFTIDLLGCVVPAAAPGAPAFGATVAFAGNVDPASTGLLRVGVGEISPATGVAIEIVDSNGARVNVGGAASAKYPLVAGDNHLKFQAAYISTDTTVGVGKANSSTMFTVAYP